MNAAVVHWQLNGVTFNDGGKAFGGFDYDTVAGAYSNVNVTTIGGTLAPGAYYNAPDAAVMSTATAFTAVSSTPVLPTTTALAFGFGSGLSTSGGTLTISSLSEGVCSGNCATFSPLRTVASGTVTAISSSAAKRWTLQGVILSDGTQVFGAFTFDANTGTYSDMSITTTNGAMINGRSYFFVSPGGNNPSSVAASSASTITPGTTQAFFLNFASALTNAGGTVAMTSAGEGTCAAANCSTINNLRTAAVNGSVTTSPVEGHYQVLPQIADGGNFTTTIFITNPRGTPITCRITFWDNNGNLLPLSFNGANATSGITVVVPGHSTQFLSTPGGSGPSVVGWGLAENVEDLGVIASYRQIMPPSPEGEATVAAIKATAGFAMAFDETTGFDTGFALANVNANDTVIENLYFYDTTGALIFSDSSHTLPPHGHESFLFLSRYAAQLNGKKGTVRVYFGTQGNPSQIIGLTGLGLRVNPSGLFTSLATFTASAGN